MSSYENYSCRCLVPNCDSDPPQYNADWISYAIPSNPIHKSSGFEPDLCHYFKQNITNSSAEEMTCLPETFTSEQVRCSQWVFDKNERSIVNDVSVAHLWLFLVIKISKQSPLFTISVVDHLCRKPASSCFSR